MTLPVNDESLCFICRMCKHMEDRADKTPPGEEIICNIHGCLGPLLGQGFPKYKGPLKNIMLSQCYRCGSPPDGNITASDYSVLGICERCAQILQKMQEIVQK